MHEIEKNISDNIREIKTVERLWNRNYLKVWGANFMLFFSFMLLTPLLPLYLNDTFGATKDEIGFVLSGYTLTTLLVRPFSGYIVDTFPRKVVLLICFSIFAAFFAGYLVAATLLTFTIVRTLHGFSFGATTVSNSTVAIDVLPSSRRSEGIGLYGLSNNIATAIAPSVAVWIYGFYANFDFLFFISLIVSMMGVFILATLKVRTRRPTRRPPLSLDRFILLKGWSQGICIVCFAFSYGILATYIAIYGKEQLNISEGTGAFFMLLALGLILSRLTGTRSLRKGRIARNASVGIIISLFGYLLFAAVPTHWAYYLSALVIGLGNGHMYPAILNMFINLARNDQRGTANSTILVSWDIGIGLGTLAGGVIAQHLGFHDAFWTAWIVNGVGALVYFFYARTHFLRNRLR